MVRRMTCAACGRPDSVGGCLDEECPLWAQRRKRQIRTRDAYSCDGCGLLAPELGTRTIGRIFPLEGDFCGGCLGETCRWCDVPLERGDGLTCSACLEMDDDRVMLRLTVTHKSI